MLGVVFLLPRSGAERCRARATRAPGPRRREEGRHPLSRGASWHSIHRAVNDIPSFLSSGINPWNRCNLEDYLNDGSGGLTRELSDRLDGGGIAKTCINEEGYIVFTLCFTLLFKLG